MRISDWSSDVCSSDLKILRDAAIARPVNIIVHTLDEVNRGLKRGEYFWVDIARDGVVLYSLPGSELATPMPLTAADAYEMASGYFADWLGKVDDAIEIEIGRGSWRESGCQ